MLIIALQIIINRPHKRNAFTPLTVREMSLCFADARDDPAVGVVVLTGELSGLRSSAILSTALIRSPTRLTLWMPPCLQQGRGISCKFSRDQRRGHCTVVAGAGEGEAAFCSGGDQDVRGKGGYVGSDGVPRLNVLDLQACDLTVGLCSITIGMAAVLSAIS